jgi:hypothetical protein
MAPRPAIPTASVVRGVVVTRGSIELDRVAMLRH